LRNLLQVLKVQQFLVLRLFVLERGDVFVDVVEVGDADNLERLVITQLLVEGALGLSFKILVRLSFLVRRWILDEVTSMVVLVKILDLSWLERLNSRLLFLFDHNIFVQMRELINGVYTLESKDRAQV